MGACAPFYFERDFMKDLYSPNAWAKYEELQKKKPQEWSEDEKKFCFEMYLQEEYAAGLD